MRFSHLRVFAAAGALASALLPQSASACGGFFCNNSQPVNQSAERILFSVADDGTVTATIQILYSGDSSTFAWVLPVAGSPEVNVSSNAVFTRLQSATNPQYLLTTRIEGSCREGGRGGPPFASGGGFSDAAAAASDAGPAVTVVDEGSVGPYDYVVISIDPETPVITDTAVAWLEDNGYQIDAAGAERLQPYLAAGMNLLAFRLTSGASVGSIRPVEITFGPGAPAVPIRPTAVAAIEDMGVLVWVLGRARSIPVNYLDLELNDALINWLSPGPTYDAVVNDAADQAGGQGFVTEFAGDAPPLAETIFAAWELEQFDAWRGQDWSDRESELVANVVYNYASFDGVREAIAATLPLPEGVEVEQVLGCPYCVFPSGTDIAGFDPVAFLTALDAQVIEPMRRARANFLGHAYLTRFYTTMSADEMDRDPMFAFNPNLPDYSNVHSAERVIECSPSLFFGDAPWRVALPSGETVRGSGGAWPFAAGDGSMPANARIRRMDTEGTGEIIVDNASVIEEALTDHNATIPRTPSGYVASGGRCSASPAGHGWLGGLLLLAAGLVLRARRA